MPPIGRPRKKRPHRSLEDRKKTLKVEQREIFDFWIRYFGERFALWAAEAYIWPPNHPKQVKDTAKTVGGIFSKRVESIAMLRSDDPGRSREDVIAELDKDIFVQVALARQQGKDIDRYNLFYELNT